MNVKRLFKLLILLIPFLSCLLQGMYRTTKTHKLAQRFTPKIGSLKKAVYPKTKEYTLKKIEHKDALTLLLGSLCAQGRRFVPKLDPDKVLLALVVGSLLFTPAVAHKTPTLHSISPELVEACTSLALQAYKENPQMTEAHALTLFQICLEAEISFDPFPKPIEDCSTKTLEAYLKDPHMSEDEALSLFDRCIEKTLEDKKTFLTETISEEETTTQNVTFTEYAEKFRGALKYFGSKLGDTLIKEAEPLLNITCKNPQEIPPYIKSLMKYTMQNITIPFPHYLKAVTCDRDDGYIGATMQPFAIKSDSFENWLSYFSTIKLHNWDKIKNLPFGTVKHMVFHELKHLKQFIHSLLKNKVFIDESIRHYSFILTSKFDFEITMHEFSNCGTSNPTKYSHYETEADTEAFLHLNCYQCAMEAAKGRPKISEYYLTQEKAEGILKTMDPHQLCPYHQGLTEGIPHETLLEEIGNETRGV